MLVNQFHIFQLLKWNRSEFVTQIADIQNAFDFADFKEKYGKANQYNI